MNSNPTDLVLVDTCMWAAFFSKSGGDLKLEVTNLLKRNRAAIIGPIATEVLLGFRRVHEAEWVASVLDGTVVLSIEWQDWRAAATLGRQLAAAGHRLPLTDLVVARVALRIDAAVFTIDPDFDHIQSLRRHS
jgi:predicted nucleic acid-binding protein